METAEEIPAMPPGGAVAAPKMSEAKLRVLSALALAPVFLCVTIIGGPAYAGMIILIAARALYEWLRLVDPAAPKPDLYSIYGGLLVCMLLVAAHMPSLGIVALALAAAALYAHRSNVEPKNAFWFALGLPYIGGGGMALIYLRDIPGYGFATTAYLLAVVWSMDIGAYCFGRLIGGRKLAPVISPGKTWSGFIGGCVLAMAAAAGVLLLAHGYYLWLGVVLAGLLAASAQAGDLFKSFFKRRAGVKDCGNIIPGHGGVLDRVDGLIFAAMLLAFMLALLGPGLLW